MENAQTKTCPRCGRTLPIENFYKGSNGYVYAYCKECSKMYKKERSMRITPPDSENPLSAYTPRQLMQELVRRGYTGKLKLVRIDEIDLNNL